MKISFAGDTNFSGIFKQNLLDEKEIFSEEFLSKFNKSGFFVLNFEGAATEKCQEQNKNINLFSPPAGIAFLNKFLNPVFNLANNHIFDCGEFGFRETKKEIKWQKLLFFGAGNNLKEASRILFLEHSDIKIALIGIAHNEGKIAGEKSAGIFCQNNFHLLKQKIVVAKKQADYVIVNYHGGEEYSFVPSPSKRNILQKIAKIDGVDIIIAHHSHTFQGIEKLGKTTIFYSLGNFIFDIPQHKTYRDTNKSAIVSFTFSKQNYEYNIQPISINTKTGTIELFEPASNNTFQKLSDFSDYKKKWYSEAHRVLFKSDSPIHNIAEEKNSLKKKGFLKIFFDKNFYIRSFRIIRNKTERNVYFGAVKFLINKKIHKTITYKISFFD